MGGGVCDRAADLETRGDTVEGSERTHPRRPREALLIAVASVPMKSAKCENCGAGATPGAVVCAYCGTTFVTAAPGVAGPPPGADPELVRLIRAGQKIEAIKVYRDSTRCGLREAKDAVEALELTLTGRR